MGLTYHDTVLKDGDGNAHFPRTDMASVHNADGTKTLDVVLAEDEAARVALGAVRTIDYGTCTTYSATATYAIGKLVIYNNRLYKCTAAITVAEAWNAAHWTAITDAQNGTVYNTTDSSFYGVRGADSVLKKLGSEPVISGFTVRSGIGVANYNNGSLTLNCLNFSKIKVQITASYVFSASYYNYVYGIKNGVRTTLLTLGAGSTGTWEYNNTGGLYDTILVEVGPAHSCGVSGVITLTP